MFSKSKSANGNGSLGEHQTWCVYFCVCERENEVRERESALERERERGREKRREKGKKEGEGEEKGEKKEEEGGEREKER